MQKQNIIVKHDYNVFGHHWIGLNINMLNYSVLTTFYRWVICLITQRDKSIQNNKHD